MRAAGAHFTFAMASHAVVAIVDEFDPAWPTLSVTNAAEDVVASLTRLGCLLPTQRLIYRDTAGEWDEIRHDGQGRFLGFAPIRERSLEAALAKLTTLQPQENDDV